MKIQRSNAINCLTIFMLFIAQFGNSQTNKLQIGVEGGPGLAGVWGAPILQQWSFINTSAGGIFVKRQLVKNFSLCADVLFEQKGAKLVMNEQTGEEIITHRYSYLMVPILGQLVFGRRLQVFVKAGPYFAWLMKASYTTNYPSDNSSADFTNQFRRRDLGATCGVGIQKNFSSFTVGVEVRSNLGLVNIRPGTYEPLIRKNISYNGLIFLGYNFSCKRL